MFTNSKLAKSIRLAMAVGVASTAMLASTAVIAQDTANADEESFEKISVTGSRIKRIDIESASPVTIIDRSDLEIAGITDIGQFLQSIPSMSGSPIGTTTNNGGNGSVLIDLRGMGTDRTLTLVNGKRVVDGGDFQAIPSAMIEQVEILKDGASAVYGADAVAGVVNIVTRRDFNGIELTAQTADWNNTDGGGQKSFSIIAGKQFDDGNFVFGAERVEQKEAFQRDTPWDFMQDSFYIYPGGCEAQVASPYDGTTEGGCYPIGSSRIPESRLPFYSQGLFLIGDPATSANEVGLMVPHDGRTYNYAPVNYLQTPYERTNIFAEANFELTDSVRFSAEFRGNQRTSAQQLAPLPFTGGDPMYNGFYDDPATGETVGFTGISQDNYYLRRAVDAYNTANGTSLVYEPVVNPRRRMIETNRRFEQTITQYQWSASLEGDINDDLSWEAFVNEGHRSNSSQDFGQFAGSRLSNALGPSADLDGNGVPECYQDVNNPGTLIVGCVPLNLFGGGVVDAGGNPTLTTLTQEMLDYVSLDTIDSITTKQRTAGANITGIGMELAGGDLGWSVGYSYWKQDYANILDSAKTIGAVTGNVGASTRGSLVNNAFFGEFYAPVFDNGEQTLAIKGGIRYDDWDAFGDDTTYQLGLEFSATADLKLRSTYGTVFRAPTITDLFGGIVDSFPRYVDPCVTLEGDTLLAGCAQEGVQTDSQVLARVGGNPELVPETGDSLTVGVVWNPEFGDHNFTFIADYWSIDLEQGINTLGVDTTLEECYVNQNQNACSLITRNSDYSIGSIIDAQLNLSEETAAGIDTEVRWNYASEYGDLRASVLWTHVLERERVPFEGQDVQDYVGKNIANIGVFAEDKANISFQWTKGDWSVSYLGEYISGLESGTGFDFPDVNEADGLYKQQIPSQFYSDIVGSFTYDNIVISAGITNVTNEAPPYIDTGSNAKTDPATYRLFGQGYYVRLKWSFE
ncbi:MAG: TonB-dependent receptor [Paraglaciecola sp.]|nr:TonB-dependent receptor [Paraglaciecola sp.]